MRRLLAWQLWRSWQGLCWPRLPTPASAEAPNGLDLSGPLDSLVLPAAGQENRFTWNLYDLK